MNRFFSLLLLCCAIFVFAYFFLSLSLFFAFASVRTSFARWHMHTQAIAHLFWLTTRVYRNKAKKVLFLKINRIVYTHLSVKSHVYHHTWALQIAWINLNLWMRLVCAAYAASDESHWAEHGKTIVIISCASRQSSKISIEQRAQCYTALYRTIFELIKKKLF